MSGGRKHTQRLILQLAALALLLNALIPAGFMLHPASHGGLTVVLCPGQGAMPGFPDDAHHLSVLEQANVADTQFGDEGACGFALAAGPLLSAGTLTLIPLQFRSALAPSPDSLPVRKGYRSAASVRGPPAIS